MPGPPSRSSFPAPNSAGAPSSRRLGVGSGTSRGRPWRAQIIVALIAVCILIAVPLYLLRRPGGKSQAVAAASATLDAGEANGRSASAAPEAQALDAGKPLERLRVAAIQHVRCGASANGGHEGSVCESLPFFEEALSKAVRDNADCTPKPNASGTLNYVLTIDFQRRALHLFAGASGEWRGKQARRAVACVKRAFAAPDWPAIQHQYRFYTIAVLAAYVGAPPGAGSAKAPALKTTPSPNFE